MSKIQQYYKPFEDWKWRDYSGETSVDIKDFILEYKDRHFFIGTDSQNYSKKRETVFTTALIAYEMGHGGCVILHKDKVPQIDHLRQRLLIEVMRSVETAWFLDKCIPSKQIIGIHIDVNQSLQFKSGKYKDELVGFVIGQGFKALIKPDAWASSKVADSRC